MGVVLSWKEIYNQSQQVFGQFGESKWIPYAKNINSRMPRKDTNDLHNIGVGKFMLLVGMGESLEKNIDVIKKYRNKFEIMVCDKGFKPLLDHGVKADYVMVCDCNIPFEYIGGAINQTKGVKLLSTPYANPEWTVRWQGDVYYFINKDALETEKKFLPYFGNDTRVIPAGSNVSNAMIVFCTGSDESQNVNFMGYEKYILIGYDYSWKPEGNYYAWLDPKPKRNYMNHRTLIDFLGNTVFTSENLFFSAKWGFSYITTFNLPVVNCGEAGLLDIPMKNSLENELSGINADRRSIFTRRLAFENMKSCFTAYKSSQLIFEESRRNLQWQLDREQNRAYSLM